MLWLQAASVALISGIAIAVIVKHGWHLDMQQLTLQGVTPEKLRLGLVLAIFSSVGFESATSLGSEARDPLVSIPRAVKWSAILAGLFFFLCAYAEVLAFRGEPQSLGQSPAPLHVLAQKAGLPPIMGTLTDLGAVVTFFSCFLACITASARVLFLMGRHGALHSVLGEAHEENQTPHRAVLLSSIAAFLPPAIMTLRGMNLFEIYGLIGTSLHSVSSPRISWSPRRRRIFLRSRGCLTPQAIGISVLAILAMGAALLGNLYPVPDAPYSYLPYLYAALLLTGFAWSTIWIARSPSLARANPSGRYFPMKPIDRELGMDRPIKRRDFLNGVAVAIGASLLGAHPACRSAANPAPIRPRSPECAACIPAPSTPLTPCAIILSGTTCRQTIRHRRALRSGDRRRRHQRFERRLFLRKAAGDNARILILDVLDDFGGHAKRNEFDINGRKLLGYGGTYAIESPSPYSPIAKSVIDDLGIDVTADRARDGYQTLSVARHGPRRFLRQRNFWLRPIAARSQAGEGRRFWRSRHFTKRTGRSSTKRRPCRPRRSRTSSVSTRAPRTTCPACRRRKRKLAWRG